MSIFSKNKRNDYEEASKSFNQNNVSKASDRIIFEQINDDDEQVRKLVDKMMEGQPLVINFDNLDRMAGNKMLAFLAGATYACDGNVVQIKESTYMFARKTDFFDGSLKEFIQGLQ